MSHNKIYLGTDATQKISNGVNQLCDIVKTTLGPAGKTVLIDNGYGDPMATKDGVTVAMSIQLADNVEQMGSQTVKQVAIKSNKESGDGTTTASVIAQVLVNNSFKLIQDGRIRNVNIFKKGMVEGMEHTIKELKSMAVKIDNSEKGRENLRKVAMISSNNDMEVADLIMEALDIIGDTGAVKIDIGKNHNSYVDQLKGMTFGSGMVSPYFSNNVERGEWKSENCLVLLTDFKISHLEEIKSALDYANKKGRGLLIICEDMDEMALRFMLMNITNGNLNACVVKAPGFGSQKQQRLNDIAAMTGGMSLLKDKVVSLREMQEQDPEKYLGKASSVVVGKNEFSIVDGMGDPEKIEAYKKQVIAQIENEDDPFLKDKHAERLAKMTKGVALIFVGADSEIAAKEKRDRVDDALMAVKAAEQEGFIAGGGLPLFSIGYFMSPDISFSGGIYGYIKKLFTGRQENDFNLGRQVFYDSIKAPMYQILENAEYLGKVDDDRKFYKNSENFTKGIDLFSGNFIDYIENGIIDPAKVTISAVTNAVSICSTLITISGVITIEEEKIKQGLF